MRVLDGSPLHDQYHAPQFLRGALIYARENWFMALWLGYFAMRAIYDLNVEHDARSLMMYSYAAFLSTFWWIHDPVIRRDGFSPEAGSIVAVSFAFGATFGVFNLGFFLFCTGFALAWPWIQRIKTPHNFLTQLVAGTAAFIVVFFTILFSCC